MLSGKRIFMNWYSLCGPVDAQIEYDNSSDYSTKYIRNLAKWDDNDDKHFLHGSLAESYHYESEYYLNKILIKNENRQKIIDEVLNNNCSHELTYTRDDLKDIGLPIENDVPKEIMEIFNLYKALF